MSDEERCPQYTKCDKIALKEYLESELRHRDKHVSAAKELFETQLASMEHAIRLARESMDKRLDSMNEFRDTLRDQAGRFVTRNEHDVLATLVTGLSESRAAQEGKASQNSVYIAYGLAFAGLLLSIVALWLHQKG